MAASYTGYGPDLFKKEEVVMTTLQAYATAYRNYEECHSTNSALVAAVNTRLGITTCTGPTITANVTTSATNSTVDVALSTANTAVTAAIADLNSAKATYNSHSPKTNAAFDASMVALKSDYASITSLRANLDTKLQNLYNAENSIADMNKVELDAEIYANILWTILATSILYVIFTKL